MFDELNEDNFFHYASSNYNYKYCKTIQDFNEDLDRFKYIKRLLTRYLEKDELRERLILNHIIVIGNMFGVKPATRMLFFKMEPHHYPAIKTFLIYLNFISDDTFSEIPLDQTIVHKLREL